MRTLRELDRLRERAVKLRREGRSRREVKQILGPMSNATLNDALKGEPPPEWTRRPNAKDELRARARDLRTQGLDYEDIAAALGVAKSSVSLWVRDLPRPARLSYAECRRRSAEGARRYRAAERPAREARRAAAREASVPYPDAEAPQPEDRAEERGRYLSRLPTHRRPPQHIPLSQDRRLGGGDHRLRVRPKWPCIEPALIAPGEGFEPSLTDSKSAVLPG